jgi:hypothetical protein
LARREALTAIVAADKGPFQPVFQGGTALSRAHRVIEGIRPEDAQGLHRRPAEPQPLLAEVLGSFPGFSCPTRISISLKNNEFHT